MNNEIISIKNLSKWYEIYSTPKDILFEFLTRRKRHSTFWALTDVDLSVSHGEIVGIIGRNGAGKSTLLKILAGLLSPSSGDVSVHGTCRAIMELGTGFNDEQTGLENIYLGGISIGLRKASIKERLPWIIDFSGLGDFVDRPVKTYSSGMRSRLAFAVAFCVRPEILIVDEALSVGDQAFVAKCTKHISDLCEEGGTALIVSHNMYFLQEKCTRVIYMDNGVIIADGDPHEVCKQHELDMAREFVKENNASQDDMGGTSKSVLSSCDEIVVLGDGDSSSDKDDSHDGGWLSVPSKGIGNIDIVLEPPFDRLGKNALRVELPELDGQADNDLRPEHSPLLLFEDDTLLGPAHCAHVDVMKHGLGRYSHWKSTLVFSSSDNSDPNENARQYRVEVRDKREALRLEAEAKLSQGLREKLATSGSLHRSDFGKVSFMRPLQMAKLEGVRLLNEKGESIDTLNCGQPARLQALVQSRVDWPEIIAGFQIFDFVGNMVVSSNTAAFLGAHCKPHSLMLDLSPGRNVFTMDIPSLGLGAGNYTVAFGMSDITRINHDDEKLIYERPCMYLSVVRQDFIQNVSYEPAVSWTLDKV